MIKCVECGDLFQRTASRQICCSLLCRFNFYSEPSGECVLWVGSLDPSGYGKIKINRKMRGAHTAVYEYFVRPVPEELEIRHTCDIPNCINIDHFLLGTRKENAQDCLERKRYNYQKDHLSKDAVREVRRIWSREKNKPRGVKFTQSDIARCFGVSLNTICRITRGKTYKNVCVI